MVTLLEYGQKKAFGVGVTPNASLTLKMKKLCFKDTMRPRSGQMRFMQRVGLVALDDVVELVLGIGLVWTVGSLAIGGAGFGFVVEAPVRIA